MTPAAPTCVLLAQPNSSSCPNHPGSRGWQRSAAVLHGLLGRAAPHRSTTASIGRGHSNAGIGYWSRATCPDSIISIISWVQPRANGKAPTEAETWPLFLLFSPFLFFSPVADTQWLSRLQWECCHWRSWHCHACTKLWGGLEPAAEELAEHSRDQEASV